MAVKVMIPTPLRRFVGDKASVEIEGDNIGQVLAHLTETHSGLRKHLFNDQGAMRNYVNLYLNDTDSDWPYHTMIYLGNGRTVYHTGPSGDDPGIVKSLTFAQLAVHPNPRWHPVASNPYFLGFYRWKILL